ncbi:MAG: V-type ATP synthase subunit I, partial [Candidatus Thermoplasmatota archaeon]|nr:V-type ATP synthase subunit I [Candidatus Thermoplasmatota archaeon]
QTDKEELNPGKADEESMLLSEYETRLSKLISILQNHKQKKSGIKALLNPELSEKQSVEETNLDELYSYAESVIDPIESSVQSGQQKYEDLTEQIQQLKEYETQTSMFTTFDFLLTDLGTSEYVIIKAGKTKNLLSLQQKIHDKEYITLFSQPLKQGKNPEWAVVLTAHISEAKTVERLTAEHIQETSLPAIKKTPKQAQHHFRQQIKKAKQQKQKIHQTLQDLSSHHLDQLLATREQIQLEHIRKQIPAALAKTEQTILIKGWVLASDTDKLQTELNQVTNDHLIFESKTPSINPDNPPTHLDTPEWAESFKTLLGLFALPKYNELNPTIMMGIFFVIFFGIMLGDAGYGLIIFTLALIGYLKFGKISPMIKNWGFMGIWLGVATTIVGFLTYSIFGNLVHILIQGEKGSLLYQFSLLGFQLPVESLKDPITILTVALVFGIIHLNIGVIYGIIQAFMQKKYKEMLTEKLCWVPLQIGGGALIGYFILDWTLSQPMFYLSAVLVVIGLIQLLYASGPIGFFNITGYVGDWLSYARLLALGLATAGMALAFNVVSQLLGEMIPFIGIVVTVLLLLVLHMVNLAISALGAGVHSLRLQYVEFFNRFYEGGGHEFTPFKIKRKYTKKESEQTN